MSILNSQSNSTPPFCVPETQYWLAGIVNASVWATLFVFHLQSQDCVRTSEFSHFPGHLPPSVVTILAPQWKGRDHQPLLNWGRADDVVIISFKWVHNGRIQFVVTPPCRIVYTV